MDDQRVQTSGPDPAAPEFHQLQRGSVRSRTRSCPLLPLAPLTRPLRSPATEPPGRVLTAGTSCACRQQRGVGGRVAVWVRARAVICIYCAGHYPQILHPLTASIRHPTRNSPETRVIRHIAHGRGVRARSCHTHSGSFVVAHRDVTRCRRWQEMLCAFHGKHDTTQRPT